MRQIPARIDFNRDVRPILSANCYFCHGPDKNKRKADLRLDTRDGLFAQIEDHFDGRRRASPEQSELFRRITADDPDERMPDPKSNKRLSDREIAIIKKWIEQGAPWQGHWAYLQADAAAGARVDQCRLVGNPIDAFVLAPIERGRTDASRAGRSRDADSPAQLRSDRPAADAGGS